MQRRRCMLCWHTFYITLHFNKICIYRSWKVQVSASAMKFHSHYLLLFLLGCKAQALWPPCLKQKAPKPPLIVLFNLCSWWEYFPHSYYIIFACSWILTHGLTIANKWWDRAQCNSPIKSLCRIFTFDLKFFISNV